jgi:hypothetical protein
VLRAEPNPAVPALSPITDTQVALAEKSVANIQRIRSLALRVTSENDWTDVSGKPYLNHSGAMKVAALFGVSLTGMRVEESREKIGDKQIIRYVARTTARFIGREVEVEGGASSDESFFAKKDGRTIPLSEVNLNTVRKKALTNAQSRAVKAILGLGGLTWKEVQGAGIGKHSLPSVDYSKKKVAENSNQPTERDSRKIRLSNMLFDMASFEDVPFERVLRRYTEFRGDDGQARWAQSVDQMSDAWVARTLEQVERDWRSVPLNAGSASKPASARQKEVAHASD